jgi:hypothetical protein
VTVLDQFPETFPEVFGTVVGDTTDAVPAVTRASVGAGVVTRASVGED